MLPPRPCFRCPAVHTTRFAHCPTCRAELATAYAASGGGDDLPELVAIAEAARTVVAAAPDTSRPPLARLVSALDALDRARRR